MPSTRNTPIPKTILLLRGVNVGGIRLTMADFKAALESLGCTEVVTFIASGNAVAHTPSLRKRITASAFATHWETEITGALAARCGITVAVVVRSSAEMSNTLAAAPWPADDHPPKLLQLGFVQGTLNPEAEARLGSNDVSPDSYWVTPRTIYQRYETGIARSTLGPLLTERVLGTPITSRNVMTVRKLIELANGQGS